MQKENVLAVPFFLQFCAERSPHTQLQSDQNGIWGSFTSHPQQKNCTVLAGILSGYHLHSNPFPISTRAQALNSNMRLWH